MPYDLIAINGAVLKLRDLDGTGRVCDATFDLKFRCPGGVNYLEETYDVCMRITPELYSHLKKLQDSQPKDQRLEIHGKLEFGATNP